MVKPKDSKFATSHFEPQKKKPTATQSYMKKYELLCFNF